jgi:spore cortex biosynthesis protein YabQ
MSHSNSMELTIFLGLTALGMAIGILWDVFRVIGKKWSLPRAIICIFDTIFWIVVTIVVFLTLMYLNDGAIRFFEFLGMIIGLILYFSTFSRVFRKFFLIIINILTKICIILLTPVKIFLRILDKILNIFLITPFLFILQKLKKLYIAICHKGKYVILLSRKI